MWGEKDGTEGGADRVHEKRVSHEIHAEQPPRVDARQLHVHVEARATSRAVHRERQLQLRLRAYLLVLVTHVQFHLSV